MRFGSEWSRVLAAGLSLSVLSGCGDLVIKVQKKPKDVNLKSIENAGALNLTNADDFLKQLDSLKAVGMDILVKELAKKDYRGEVRNAIRKYRTFLLERAKGPVQIDDSFYYSSDECRKTGLSLNMEQAHGFLGLILKTAVLSKLSEVSAGKLNPELQGASKELAALAQVILMELGIKVKGDVNVDKSSDVTKTIGNLQIQLTELKDEAVDAATKKADATQILSMNFTRALGDNYVGSFDAVINLSHEISDGVVETLEAKLAVERKAVDDSFVHSVNLFLGVKDKAPSYSRRMTFEQVKTNKKQLQITDSYKSSSTNKEETYVTLIDIEKGSQCKLLPGSNPIVAGKGDEDAFLPPKGTDPVTPPAPVSAPAPAPAPISAPTKGSDPVIVVNDQDEDKTSISSPTAKSPGTSPSQTPSQSPTQQKVL